MLAAVHRTTVQNDFDTPKCDKMGEILKNDTDFTQEIQFEEHYLVCEIC